MTSYSRVQDKRKEHGMYVYIPFINLTKNIGSVTREVLWQIFMRLGCLDKYFKLIKQFHKNENRQEILKREFLDSFVISN